MIFESEREAVSIVLDAGDIYGYGYMIAQLKTAWANNLMEMGLSRDKAILVANANPFDNPESNVTMKPLTDYIIKE